MYPSEVKVILEAFGNATIDKIALNGKKNRIFLFDNEGRVHAFFTDGDCCSQSWVENIEFQGTVLGRPLREITNEDDLPVFKKVNEHKEGFDDYSQLLDYSTTFHTEGGALKVEYRNESNGYYGGSLEYEGVLAAIPDNLNFIVGDM
jgi:hypothetical protein